MIATSPNNHSLGIQVESGAGKRRLISLTPLIDVVFILLVFYMLAAAAPRWEAIKLDSPVQGAEQNVGPPALVIRLEADGGLTLDGADTSVEGLSDTIETALDAAPDRPVVVQPAPGVPLQRVVTILGRLSALPVPAVSLMRVEPPQK